MVNASDEGGRSTFRARLGAWAFRQRSWLPVPLALVLVFVHRAEVRAAWPLVLGPALVILGQALRLRAVRHIGTVSRTRAIRLGPLVTDGPYAVLRNPLYVGNWLLWTGFTIWSALLWMLPIVWIIFAVQYGAITRWEEERLQLHFGSSYAAYTRTVPRWRPRWSAWSQALTSAASHPWREVVFSERGTLLAVTVMSILLLIKQR